MGKQHKKASTPPTGDQNESKGSFTPGTKVPPYKSAVLSSGMGMQIGLSSPTQNDSAGLNSPAPTSSGSSSDDPWKHVSAVRTVAVPTHTALGIPSVVKRHERNKLDSEKLQKLYDAIKSPLEDKIELFDKPALNSEGTLLLNKNASIRQLLHRFKSHITYHDCDLSFSNLPLVDFSDPNNPVWPKDRPTINLWTEFDRIDATHVALTVSYIRQFFGDAELPLELTLTHDFIMNSCENTTGAQSLYHIVKGECDQYESTDRCQTGGPLTLIILLKQLTSSSQRALENLQKSLKKLKISSYADENVPHICNMLHYLIDRLDQTALPHDLTSDLMSLMQSSSNDDFNGGFKTWKNQIDIKILPEPSWREILSRARILYDCHSEDWKKASPQNPLASSFAANGEQGKSSGTGGKDNDNKSKRFLSEWVKYPNKQEAKCSVVQGQNCWTKTITLQNGEEVDAKWCGICVHRKNNGVRGMWRSGDSAHFTKDCPKKKPKQSGTSSESANLATESDDATPSPPTHSGGTLSDLVANAAGLNGDDSD